MPWRIETKVSPDWVSEEDEQWVLLLFKPRKRGRFETEAEAEAMIWKMNGYQPHARFRVIWSER